MRGRTNRNGTASAGTTDGGTTREANARDETAREEATRDEAARERTRHETPPERREALVRLATRLLGSREAGEDVVQDALLRRLAHAGPAPDVPQAWLRRVTCNLAIDRLRRARREREARSSLPDAGDSNGIGGDEEAPSPEETLVRRERCREAIRTLLDGSGPRDTAAVLLREVFGLDHAELARASERGEAASRQAVSRALRRARLRTPEVAPADTSDRTPGSPLVVEREDDTLRRFERAVSERDPAPLLGALDISAAGPVEMQCRPLVSCVPDRAGHATTRLRVDTGADGLRLSLVLDGIVLCTLSPRTVSPSRPARPARSACRLPT